MTLISTTRGRALFYFFYGLNPLVLYFVGFAWYTFWQAVPSAFVCAYLLNRRLRFGLVTLPIAVLFGFVYLTRPTILAVGLLFALLLMLREGFRLGLAFLLLFLFCSMALFRGNAHEKDVFLTAYVGIGAYPNPYVDGLKDENANRLYEEKTGVPIGIQQPRGLYFQSAEARAEFRRLTREAYVRILRKDPVLLVRNAAINFAQSFFLGYFTDSLALSYVSAVLGLCVIIILIVTGQFLFLAAVAANSITFTLYCPPIQAYMYGTYVLLVGAFIAISES